MEENFNSTLFNTPNTQRTFIALLKYGALSKMEVSSLVGVTVQAASYLINNLEKQGSVFAISETFYENGRPFKRYLVNSRFFTSCGVHLEGNKINFNLIDAKGTVIYKKKKMIKSEDQLEKEISNIFFEIQHTDQLMHSFSKSRILGISTTVNSLFQTIDLAYRKINLGDSSEMIVKAELVQALSALDLQRDETLNESTLFLLREDISQILLVKNGRQVSLCKRKLDNTLITYYNPISEVPNSDRAYYSIRSLIHTATCLFAIKNIVIYQEHTIREDISFYQTIESDLTNTLAQKIKISIKNFPQLDVAYGCSLIGLQNALGKIDFDQKVLTFPPKLIPQLG